jgi:hypothetical protein
MWVEGNENNFIRDMDQFELERQSRRNCHPYCDFRALHESGQGILLHLRDLGLTNEAAFGEKKRVHLTFQLRNALEPKLADEFVNADLKKARYFHVCILRGNQLFTGNHLDCRFEYLNEKLLK